MPLLTLIQTQILMPLLARLMLMAALTVIIQMPLVFLSQPEGQPKGHLMFVQPVNNYHDKSLPCVISYKISEM
jgi:hypothetical protein